LNSTGLPARTFTDCAAPNAAEMPLSPEFEMPQQRDKKRIVFHIGLEKTGTTSFQRFCTEHRAVLLRHGVLYPTGSLAYARTSRNHKPLAACYFAGHPQDFDFHFPRRGRSAILRSLRREIDRSPAPAVLVSAEHFSSRFREDEIGRLASDFSSYECQIAVVLREHAARICSAYSTTVAAGRHLTLDEYIDELASPDNRYTRYKDTLAPWEQIFGRQNIRIFTYGNGDNVIDLLVKQLVSPRIAVPAAASYADHESPGACVTEALRLVSKEISSRYHNGGTAQSYLGHLLARHAHNSIRRSLMRIAHGADDARLRLSEANLHRLKVLIDIDRKWLDDRYGVRLPDTPMQNDRPAADGESVEHGAADLLSRAVLEQNNWVRWTRLFGRGRDDSR